jgi:glutaconate CoA-transferase subunit B
VTPEQVSANTGWPVHFAATVATTPPPTAGELAVLREVQERTRRAHAGQAA